MRFNSVKSSGSLQRFHLQIKDWHYRLSSARICNYMITIKEIARLTGVSTATVSNVLNGKSGAAGAAKAGEIIDVARNLHYMPNTLASVPSKTNFMISPS